MYFSHAFRKLHTSGFSSIKSGVISFLDRISNRPSSRCDLLVGDAALTEVVLLSSEHCSHVLHAAGTWGPSPLGLGGVVVSAELATVVGAETGTRVTRLLSVEVLGSCYSGKSMIFGPATTLSGCSSSLNTTDIEKVNSEIKEGVYLPRSSTYHFALDNNS